MSGVLDGGRVLGRRIREAVWWAQDYVYAVQWQVRGVLTHAQPADYLTGDRAPVIVIPGIYESWSFMLPLIGSLHGAGHPVHVITALHRNRRPVAFGAAAVLDYIRRENLSGVVIVAHSKGGLIGKQVMMTLQAAPAGQAAPAEQAAPAVKSMVAVCTPFSGSRYAEFMLLPSLRAFRANDAALVALRANEVANARIVSVFGRFDPHIPEGSQLPGAKNIEIDTGGHFRIMAHPDTIEAVLRAARDGS